MYTKEQYEKTLKLYKQGLNNRQIANRLNITRSVVYGWTKLMKKPRGRFLDRNFNKLSWELGYILGVIYGDGYISFKRSKVTSKIIKGQVGLEVKDEDFANFFKSQIEKWSGLKVSSGFNKKGLYFSMLSSLRASNFLDNFDINDLIIAKKEVRAGFLRGFFDAEGGVSGSNLKTPRIATRFVSCINSDKKLILLVKDLIESIGIKVQNIDGRTGIGFNEKGISYRLRIGGKENLIKYKNKVGFSIERKNKKLDEVLNSYKT